MECLNVIRGVPLYVLYIDSVMCFCISRSCPLLTVVTYLMVLMTFPSHSSSRPHSSPLTLILLQFVYWRYLLLLMSVVFQAVAARLAERRTASEHQQPETLKSESSI